MADITDEHVRLAFSAVMDYQKAARDALWRCPSTGQVRAMLEAVAPVLAAAERERIRRGVLARELILQHPEDGDRVAVLTLDLEQIIGAEDGSDEKGPADGH